VSELYFKDEMMASDHVRHFASDVLGMVTIMYAFLMEKARPRGWLPRHIECFEALFAILCILRRGDMTDAIHSSLSRLILKHNTLFLELYGEKNAKIKFHHVYHIPDDMLGMECCLSCFPTERKNKDAKHAANASDKDMERTATIAFLNKAIEYWDGNDAACQASSLHGPVQKLMMFLHDRSIMPEAFSRSAAATLPCGEAFPSDMMLLQDGSLGQVIDFWGRDDNNPADIVVGCNIHRRMAGPLLFEGRSYQEDFRHDFVELLPWYRNCVGNIVAIIPVYT
jgi:hypothetical protein